MASSDKHKIQYEDNKRIYQEEFFNRNENLAWKVTVIFYAALHYIESKFPNNIPCESHKDRYNIISKSYKGIIDPYSALYSLSIKSRYKCIKIKNRDVMTALECLNDIEEKCK